jgi:diguanylate cyclase (GGDEF)-like protein
MKVLVCDDTIVNRQIIGAYLQKMGHQPIFAENGEQAIKIFSEESPDLVLIDVEMPEMDGYQATKAMRLICNDFTAWTPVIFISGCIDDASIVKGIEAGGDDYLTKPVSQAVLKAKMHAMSRLVSMKDRMMEMSSQLHITNEKLKESNKLLAALSLKDPLTQLGNRRAFEENLSRLSRTAVREHKHISLLMIDVDNFKKFNDTYGHQAGDQCLQQVAKALQTSLHRAADFGARYGGEEFAIILPNTPLSGAMHVAERVRQCVEMLQLANENAPSGFISISVGVASTRADRSFTSESLIGSADSALYEAKKEGRNCIMGAKTLITADSPNPLEGEKMQRHFPHSGSHSKH